MTSHDGYDHGWIYERQNSNFFLGEIQLKKILMNLCQQGNLFHIWQEFIKRK